MNTPYVFFDNCPVKANVPWAPAERDAWANAARSNPPSTRNTIDTAMTAKLMAMTHHTARCGAGRTVRSSSLFRIRFDNALRSPAFFVGARNFGMCDY